jgi:glyoxylase-like metal-dependent hydrolase (beta-lactamase superfamily II)
MLGTGDCFDFRLGDMRITALCDLAFSLDKASLIGVPPEAVDKCMPAAEAAASGTAFLARLNGATILVDAGAGETFDGRVCDALAKASVSPEEIDHIFLTHLHLDHVGGIIRSGKPVFPRAAIWLAEAEHAFWHDDAATSELSQRLTPILGEIFIPTHVNIARTALAAYEGRVNFFSGEQELIPGVKTVLLHGHTPGHSGYVLGGEGQEKFFIWGDAVHIAPVQFALPEAGMVFDWNAAMAVASRREAFEMAVRNNWLSAGMHLPFPAVGKLTKSGTDYSFAPLP